MKIRRDSAFVSSVLFTISLLWLIPPFFKGALEFFDAGGETDWRLFSEMWGAFDIASLTIVMIGLIVTWGGYNKKVRWTWFVMFLIVWGWFFPAVAFHDFVYPLYCGALQITSFSGFIRAAFGEPGIIRGVVHEMFIFALMVIALLLPLRAFFWGRGRQVSEGTRIPVSDTGQPRWPLRRVIGVSGFTLLFIVVGLFVWTHLAVHEIPPEQLQLHLRIQLPLPPPPPPSNVADKCR